MLYLYAVTTTLATRFARRNIERARSVGLAHLLPVNCGAAPLAFRSPATVLLLHRADLVVRPVFTALASCTTCIKRTVSDEAIQLVLTRW